MRTSTVKYSPRFLIAQFFSFLLFGVLTQSAFFQSLNFDILQAIQSIRSDFLDYGLTPFIVLGSPEISVSALLLFSFVLFQKRNYKKAYLLLAGLLLLTGIEFLMKHSFVHPKIPYEMRRGFPGVPGVGMMTLETPYSFPSGHSLRSMFLMGAFFLWSPLSRIACRKWIIGLCFCVQAFGMNYYGFHWLGDVVAGYWVAIIGLQAIAYFESRPL